MSTTEKAQLDPKEYRFHGAFYCGMTANEAVADAAAELQREFYDGCCWAQLLKNIGYRGKAYEKMAQADFDASKVDGLQCDCCGAHFKWGAQFVHTPSSEIITVGWICAGELDMPNRAQMLKKRSEKKMASARAEERAAERARQLLDTTPELAEAFKVEHFIIQDIYAKLLKYGTISDAQSKFVLSLAKEAKDKAARIAERAKNEPTWQPVEEGRRVLKGKVLCAKLKRSDYGSKLKMLLHAEGDQKVWGSVPNKLNEYDHPYVLEGSTVQFTATVQRSDKDPCFGFFSRPTKASFITMAKLSD